MARRACRQIGVEPRRNAAHKGAALFGDRKAFIIGHEHGIGILCRHVSGRVEQGVANRTELAQFFPVQRKAAQQRFDGIGMEPVDWCQGKAARACAAF